MRIVESVMANQMASLLLTRIEFEVTPEPFRRQGRVLLTINFSEYCTFIENYLDRMDWLATPTQQLLAYLKAEDTQSLYLAFMKDIAVACAKELYYAEQSGAPATAIAHTVNDAPLLSFQEFDAIYESLGRMCSSDLIHYMSDRKFRFNKTISEYNLNMWKYACVTWAIGCTGGESWNIDYNTLFPEYIQPSCVKSMK